MAALSRSSRVYVRAPRVGDGPRLAALWRELWESHERLGGYPGSRDGRTYAQLAARLDEDARVRAGHPTLGRHIHLVAELDGAPCGQVEGWLESHGSDATTPLTCEVRSLVVHALARRLGAGRALLEALETLARGISASSGCVVAAEVLEPNPAQTFYARVGFTAVSWNARLPALFERTALSASVTTRLAVARDAAALARLESELATRRRLSGDIRFDGPRVVDATMLAEVAASLSMTPSFQRAETLVAVDPAGTPRAAASLVVHALDPPFLPMRRALLGRIALDPAFPTVPLVTALLTYGRHRAALQHAPLLEVADLPSPGSELHGAVLASGAHAWSKIMIKNAN